MSNNKPAKRQVKVARKTTPLTKVATAATKKKGAVAKPMLKALMSLAGMSSHPLEGLIDAIPDDVLERYRGRDPNDTMHRPSETSRTRRREYNYSDHPRGGREGNGFPTGSFPMPVRMESGVGPFYLRRNGKAQRLTDLSGESDPEDSIRYEFSDLIPYSVATDATPHLQQLLKTGGGTYLGAIAITPSDMSPKLAVLETLYDNYCFRELTFSYIPTVGTNTPGTIGLCVSVEPLQDTTLAAAGITFAQVLEHSCATGVTVNMPTHFTYKCHGTKTYVTTSVGATIIDQYAQGYLFCSGTGLQVSIPLGNIVVSGVIDLYTSSEVNTNPVLQEELIWKRYCFREWWQYYHSGHFDGIKPLEFYQRYCAALRVREARKLIRVQVEPVPFSVEEKKN